MVTEEFKMKAWSIALFLYFLIFGLAAAVYLLIAFPEVGDAGKNKFPLELGSPDRQLLLLAFAAGVAGSFLQGGQSLVTYIGNRQFTRTWAAWYLLRLPIGGILGLTIYFVFRAGLIAGATVVNPYGVVAIGILGGWYSKVTTDKLKEVFETLFRTDEDRFRRDKLTVNDGPVIDAIQPSPVAVGVNTILVTGHGFKSTSTFLLNGQSIVPKLQTPAGLLIEIPAGQRPAAGHQNVKVRNPDGAQPVSPDFSVEFQ